MDKDLIDKIPLYVRGILSPDEQKFIQEQIKVDPELAEEVKLLGIMNAFKNSATKKYLPK
jgi:anti-sigma factor RsiW